MVFCVAFSLDSKAWYSSIVCLRTQGWLSGGDCMPGYWHSSVSAFLIFVLKRGWSWGTMSNTPAKSFSSQRISCECLWEHVTLLPSGSAPFPQGGYARTIFCVSCSSFLGRFLTAGPFFLSFFFQCSYYLKITYFCSYSEISYCRWRFGQWTCSALFDWVHTKGSAVERVFQWTLFWWVASVCVVSCFF